MAGGHESTLVWRPGQVVDSRYEVVRELGRGGMGAVYQVRHLEWGADLAAKVPLRDMFHSDADRERFSAEAQNWVGLGLHPNVCGCHYVRTIDGVPTVFAEYVSGGTLNDLIDNRGLYAGTPQEVLARILDLAAQIAWGLEHAHARGLVHRDVKPGNVLLGDGWTAKVTDFGLSAAREMRPGESDTLYRPGASVLVPNGGLMTPLYASPEQAAGSPLGRRTDVYSLAASILAMFTGGATWLFGMVAAEALHLHRSTRPADLSTPEIPDDVADLLLACLDHDPGARPATMADLAAQFQAIHRRITGRAYPRRPPAAVDLRADELNNRALSLLDLGRTSEADEALTAALRADPHHVAATFNSGLLRWRRGEVTDEQLLTSLSRLSEELDDPAEGMIACALVHMERGDLTSARSLLEPLDQGRHSEARYLLRTSRSGQVVDAGCTETLRISWNTYSMPPPDHGLRLSADERLALTVAEDHTVRLFDVRSGRTRCTLYGHDDRVNSVDISADGRRAVSAAVDGTVRFWDLMTDDCLKIVKVTRWKDGNGARRQREQEKAEKREGRIVHWSRAASVSPMLNSAYSPVRISADGSVVAWAEADGRIQIWDFTRGKRRAILAGHSGARLLELSAGGNLALTCFSGHLGAIRLWDLRTGRHLWEANGSRCELVQFGPGDRTVIAAFADEAGSSRVLRVWERNSGRMLRTVTFSADRSIESVALSEDARRLLVGGRKGNMEIWDLEHGRCLRTYTGHQERVSVVRLNPDGRSATSASLDRTARIWRLPGRYEAPMRISRPRAQSELSAHELRLESLLERAETAMNSSAYADALESLKEARALPGCERLPRVVEMWKTLGHHTVPGDLRTAWVARTLHTRVNGEDGGIALDVTRDGHLAATSAEGRIQIWEVATGNLLRSIDSRQHGVSNLRFSPDGTHLTSAGWSDTVTVWSVETGRCVNVVGLSESNQKALSGDGRLVLVAHGVEGSIRLWDAFSGKCLRRLPGLHRIDELWVDEEGRRALSVGWGVDTDSSSDETRLIRLWDLANGRCLLTLHPQSDKVYSLCLSADGSYIFAAGSTHRIRMWDVMTGRCVRAFDPLGYGAFSLKVSTDGRFVVSGGVEPEVHVWDVATGRSLRVLEGHTTGVGAITISPDGTSVLTTDKEGVLRAWELDWEMSVVEPEAQEKPADARVDLETAVTMIQIARQYPWAWSHLDTDQFYELMGWSAFEQRSQGVRAKTSAQVNDPSAVFTAWGPGLGMVSVKVTDTVNMDAPKAPSFLAGAFTSLSDRLARELGAPTRVSHGEFPEAVWSVTPALRVHVAQVESSCMIRMVNPVYQKFKDKMRSFRRR